MADVGSGPQRNNELIDSLSLLSWGTNSFGQLGQSHREDQWTPKKLCNTGLNTAPHSITGGGGHTLLLSADRSLWVCGSNSNGQLGLGHREDKQELMQVTFPTPVKAVQVSGGWDFTIACTGDGEVYTWGSNGFSQLGRDTSDNHSTIPEKVSVPCDCRVVCVAAGLRHALALSGDGSVYGWGQNKKGQLGNVVDTQGQVMRTVRQPTKLLLKEKIVQVVAGAYHSAALAECGRAYLWGCNKFGQLAVDPSAPVQHGVQYPQQCVNESGLDGKKIQRLEAGWTHTLAVTDTKDVYSWGRGDYGQLGRPCDGSHDFTPKVVTGLSGVRYVACGAEHNLCLTDDGCLFTWGWNEHGICGTGDESNVPFPSLLSTQGRRVVTVGCGAGHSFAVIQN